MNLNTSTDFTKVIYKALKEKFTTINWNIYPEEEKLNKANPIKAKLSLKSFEHIGSNSDQDITDLYFNINLEYPNGRAGECLMRDAAFAIGKFLNGNWYSSSQIEDSNIISNQEDSFTPVVEGFKAWEIVFVVRCVTGETIYEPNGISPVGELGIDEDVFGS